MLDYMHFMTTCTPPPPLCASHCFNTQYIHSKGLGHADMSLENTVIDIRRENSYIIDFGMSVAMPSDREGRR